MGLSRNTKKARYMKESLKKESPCEREVRLTNMQQRSKSVRSRETSDARKQRLTALLKNRQLRRDRESTTTRAARLSAMQSHATKSRDSESPKYRAARLSAMQAYATQSRDFESPSSRAARLSAMQAYASQSRDSESPSSRAARLSTMAEHASQVRECESPPSRGARLANLREHDKRARRHESLELREVRLTKKRICRTSQSQIINEVENFENKIAQVADVVCYSCSKLLYKRQARWLSCFTITILPQGHPDFINCCNRCANHISKNKIPPISFLNNMGLIPIPPEIDCLNEMEIRLISRIRPFMKVVRLGGKYGQQGFRGQAILFAQDVEEVSEQLPVSANDAGMVIVAESLENVSSTRKYTVDVGKIRNAFEWLKRHNHLYATVDFNCEISNAEINKTILESVTTDEPQQLHAHEECHFKNIGDDLSILRGHFHQGCDRFGLESRGRQCMANAATAIVYSTWKPLLRWTPLDLDRVLLAGDKYFIECLSSLAVKPNYLNAEELLPHVIINDKMFDIEILPDLIVGLINPTSPSHIPEGYFNSIEAGVEYFFRNQSRGIVTCQTQYSVSIFRDNDDYFLFDSHSRGPKGFAAGERGLSMCMKFPTVESLSKHLIIVLQVRKLRDMQYSITVVTTITNHAALHTQAATEPMPSTSSSSLPDQPLCDSEIISTTIMPIESDVPHVNSVVSDVASDSTIPICNLKRRTAPPISAMREQRAEELAWVKLFPDGRNGFGEPRQIPITPLDYFQARIMSEHKRFQVNEYLFYALSIVELYKAQQNVSVCGRLRQGGLEPRNVVQNVHLVMRNIRGTQSYWHRAFTDLMAMIKNLGPPHFYMTLSCNDLNWPDVLKALLVADNRPDFPVSDLTFSEKMRLVQSYPVTLCRQFMMRLNTFLTVLKSKNNPILGRPVVDLWWRVEFQLRGSPHVHMVIWCQDMPPFDTNEGTLLLDSVITCRLPDPELEPDLNEMVLRLQNHNHTHTCYKNNNFCRFGFPRPTTDRSKILDDDAALRNGGRFYMLRRVKKEENINNYNIRILKMWQANMDIQPCSTATGIAYYISKYISKSEPTEISQNIRNAIRRVQENGGSMAKQIFSIQNAILTHREVSACECAVRLCHLKMRDSSRKVVFVNTCLPELRYRMLRIDENSNEPFKNIFDRYAARPQNLEELSLHEFAVWYEPVVHKKFLEDDQDVDAYDEDAETTEAQQHITLLDNQGRMKKRKRSAILRTRYYTPTSDPEAYYYSLLVTHVPFRSESELMDGFNSAKEAFLRKQQLIRPLQVGNGVEEMTRWEEEINQAIGRLLAENLATGFVLQEDENFNHLQEIFEENIAEIEQGEENDNSELGVMTDMHYTAAVNSLNYQQRQLLKTISEKLLCLDKTTEPLRVFVTGGAGSGKSFTLKVIVNQILRLSHCPTNRSVAVTAPTGVAARLIGGNTLHSTFALPIEKGKTPALRQLCGERLHKERLKWNYIDWLIIDEISMVPYSTLRNIHLRLQQLKMNDAPFGGINVVLFGDLMQLPPVSKSIGGAYCFKQPQPFSAEINLWELFSFCELPQNMRQSSDTTFIDILNNLRVGQLTMEQLEILDCRRVPLVGEFEDGECIRIFPTTKQVNDYNFTMTQKMKLSQRVYNAAAVDVSVETKNYGQRLNKDFIPLDPNKTGGLPNSLEIGVGSRVMLRKNINVNHGLVNGAMGVIKTIEWPSLRRDQLEPGELPNAVYVQFDDPSIRGNIPGTGVKIEPTIIEYDALKGQGKVERRMLPLILCWAVTVHKLQGTTLDKAVIDLSGKLFAKGQAYVALSRVRTLDGIAISSLDPRKLLNKPYDENSLEELNRLRNLKLLETDL